MLVAGKAKTGEVIVHQFIGLSVTKIFACFDNVLTTR